MAQIVGGFIMPHDPLITGNPEIADAGQVERVNAAFGRVVERVKGSMPTPPSSSAMTTSPCSARTACRSS